MGRRGAGGRESKAVDPLAKRVACRQIALAIWSKEPKLAIKEVAYRKELQELGGGSDYEPETLHQWISAVDTRDPSKTRGRKRKNNSPPDDPQ